MSSHDENPQVLAYRVRQNSRKIEELEAWRREVDKEDATMKEQFRAMSKALVDVTNELHSLRRVIIGFALTVAGSAIFIVLSTRGGLP